MDTLYRTPFCAAYWRAAAREFSSTKTLVAAALLSAVCGVLDAFFIPVGGSLLQIRFSFFAVALCSMVTGPLIAIPSGFIVDLLSYLVGGGSIYGYFPGYILSAIGGAMIYAMFLYRSQVTLWRVYLSKLLVNLLINVLLGSVWRAYFGGKAYIVYLWSSGLKNLVLLPLEVMVLTYFLKKMLPALKKMHLINPAVEFTMTKKDIVISVISGVVGAAALLWYLWYKLPR